MSATIAPGRTDAQIRQQDTSKPARVQQSENRAKLPIRYCLGDICRDFTPISGRRKLCKACRDEARRVYQREYSKKRQRDPNWKAHKRELRKASYHRHRETLNANRRSKSKMRYAVDDRYRQKRLANVRRSYWRHRAKRRAAHKAWAAKNIEHRRAYCKAYKARKKAQANQGLSKTKSVAA